MHCSVMVVIWMHARAVTFIQRWLSSSGPDCLGQGTLIEIWISPNNRIIGTIQDGLCVRKLDMELTTLVSHGRLLNKPRSMWS